MIFRSLRGTLTLLWLFVTIVCAALAFQLHGLFELGIGGQITEVRQAVEVSAKNLSREFDLYLAGFSEVPPDFNDPGRRRELLLLLDLGLGRYNGIEGGFWSPESKFLAYSFPTHDPVKRDVPEAESSRISALNQRVFSTGKEETARFDSSAEVLLLHAVPVRPNLVVWTMGRAHVGVAAAFEKLAVGFVALLLLILATGGLILWYLQNWGRELSRLEERLGSLQTDSTLPETGLQELDRLITAFNRQTETLRESQKRFNELSAQLHRADRLAALGRMSAGLAHEIRNPIGAMRLHLENALSKTDGEYQKRIYQTVLREVSRLDDLLERLLAVARLDKLTIKQTPLGRWLEDCVSRFRHENSARLEVDAPSTEWPMDEHQMARALDNLLTNALRHTPVDGWVRITAERRGDSCYLVVEDSGSGVPQGLREKIFEPFASFRSDGTGLGLAISREIVEAHGGTICCTQGAIGARFEIRLPWRES